MLRKDVGRIGRGVFSLLQTQSKRLNRRSDIHAKKTNSHETYVSSLISWHHGREIKGPPETPRTITALSCRGV